MWEADRAEEWAQCINNARRYVSDQIVLGGTTPLDDLLTPLKSGLMYTFLPKTSSKMHGSRTREMTTYIAPPKCGKSSLLRQMVYETLLLTDEHVGGFFLEETKEKTQQSIIAYHCNIAVNKFRANPHLADKYKVQEAYDTLLPRLHLFTHRGLTISDDLLERKLDYMVKGLGCKTIVIDHASFIVGTRTSKDERRDIDQMLTRLARHVEDEDYRLNVVAHIKRGGREQSRESKQKYPYWEILSPDDARGSGAFEQLSHNMIGIERQRLDPESENTRGLLRIRILHNREWGVEGVGDYLVFNENGKFVPVEPEY
jgi:twinkle protein